MNKQKHRWKKGICMLLLLGLATGIGYVVQVPEPEIAQAASTRRKLVELSAYYNGDSEALMVGETIPKREIEVVGIYDDGSEAIIRSFTMSTTTVQRDGENTINISYNGLRTTVTIFGKKVESLEAEYMGEDVTVGQSVKRKDIAVIAYFTDGSKEEITKFTMASDVVKREGENELRVSYGGKNAEIIVYGIPPLAIEEIDAWYDGDGVIVGNRPNKADIHVMAYYNDGSDPKEITGYTLSPDEITKVGTNKITVVYDSKKVTLEIEGLPKEVVSIKAKYVGGALEVGRSVKKEDIEVTATYNDGTTGVVTDFRIVSPKIYEIGSNEIEIECGDAEPQTIIVRGVKAEYIDYSNAVSATVGKDSEIAKFSVAAPYGYSSDDLKIVQLKDSEVSQAMKRAVANSDYMAFELKLSDELEQELPLTVKTELPKGFEKEGFAVYYTTNGKTVAAKMNGEFLEDGTYQFKVFQQGMYVFVNTQKEKEVVPEEDEKENGEETEQDKENENVENTEKAVPVKTIEVADIQDGKLTLKVGKKYQLKVNVLPKNATNQELLFTTSRKKFVTVSEEGVLTGVKAGTALITIWAEDGTDVSAKVLVYVEK